MDNPKNKAKQRKGIKTQTHYNIWIIISVGIVMCAVLCALIAAFYQVYYDKKVTVSSADELVSAIEENSNSANSNAVYSIANDIKLDSEHLNEIYSVQNQSFNTGAWFYGKMNGHGCTITIDAEVTAPLFDKICEGAVIEGINFKCDTIKATDGVDELALITKENYGEIRDISVGGNHDSDGCTVIDYNNEKPLAVSVVCVKNYNNISRCAVKSRLNVASVYCQGETKLNAATRWDSYFGAVAALNMENGNIHGAIVSVKFDDDFTPLLLRRYNKSDDINTNIGYIVGYSSDFAKIDSDAIFYVIGGDFVDNVTDYCHLPQKNTRTFGSDEKSLDLSWTHWDKNNFPKVLQY